MKKVQGKDIYSPSDLIAYTLSPFGLWMNRKSLEDNGDAYERTVDELGMILQKMGDAHEAAQLQKFKKTYRKKDIAEISRKTGFDDAAAQTVAAMEDGKTLIYQAALHHANFAGYSDFLIRVDGETSRFGEYYYECWDTKLSRHVKPYAILQLCCYSEMLSAMQGYLPKDIVVVLGGRGGTVRHALRDFYSYYLVRKDAFLRDQDSFDPDKPPLPKKSQDHGEWDEEARKYLERIDHLSLCANIREQQITRLTAHGIRTFSDLAHGKVVVPPKGMDQPVFDKLRLQARLQIESKGKARPEYRVADNSDDSVPLGLRCLPEASKGDVYFDLEAYPLFEPDGLVYLFGAMIMTHGKAHQKAWWAHSQSEEKLAFSTFIDWVTQRRKTYKDLHVYHYGAFEPSNMLRLSLLHSAKEAEVTTLIREGVFVDLYRIVRQALIIGEPGYSLKNVEKLYGEMRSGDVTSAGDSIIGYACYCETEDKKYLREIRKYNIVDCESTKGLADWLRELQATDTSKYGYAGKLTQDDEEPLAKENELDVISRRMILQVEDGKIKKDKEVFTSLAYFLTYFRRERKPFWWSYFARLGCSSEEISDDMDCLGGLSVVRASGNIYSLAYSNEQETKLEEGKTGVFTHDFSADNPMPEDEGMTARVLDIDREKGRLTVTYSGSGLRKGMKNLSFIPVNFFDRYYNGIHTSLKKSAERWESSGSTGFKALDAFLKKEAPRVKGIAPGSALIDPRKSLEDELFSIVQHLDESVLPIQGPPGTGKTRQIAELIVRLADDNPAVRIGVAAFSHKAVNNVLIAVKQAEQRRKAKTGLSVVKLGKNERKEDVEHLRDEGVVSKDQTGSVYFRSKTLPDQVIGGTTFIFAVAGAERALDYLIVDEAGQLSAAALVAMGRSAVNIILAGDQMQLEQVAQGTHPEETGVSCLEYLVGNEPTISPEKGVFLEKSYRMHPKICGYVSEMFYEGKLSSDSATQFRKLVIAKNDADDLPIDSGILYIPVEHTGCTQGSDKEVAVVNTIVGKLLANAYIPGKGEAPQKITKQDILCVTPYNLQRQKLQTKLGKDIRVGTVDKFQGQEAPVVIISLCASSAEDAPRGIDFILNAHRLNVAISRAMVLTIVVGNPALAQTVAGSVENMKTLNRYCRLLCL